MAYVSRGGGRRACARPRSTLTKETGEIWEPAEVQECIWSWANALYEMAGEEGETRTAAQLVEQNALSNERIADVPDFGILLGRRDGNRTAENGPGAPGAPAKGEESQEPGAPREVPAGAS